MLRRVATVVNSHVHFLSVLICPRNLLFYNMSYEIKKEIEQYNSGAKTFRREKRNS